MPIIRATVTTDDAAPNARRPAASTAAVERGVTVNPNPRPNAPSAERDRLDRPCPAVHVAIADEPADAEREPDERDEAERQHPDGEPRDERPEGGRAGQGAEGEPLLVGTAVEHPIHEDRARR